MESQHPDSSPPPASWRDEDLDNPHAVADKARRVQSMFAAIAGSYDLNNRLHSLWRDQAWRRKAVKLCQLRPGDRVVDVACGTGDLTLAFAGRLYRIGGVPRPSQVIGVDFTREMLLIAARKADRHLAPIRSNPATNLSQTVRWITGDAMRLPMNSGAADVVSIAFGIRNVADPMAAIREFHRVLRPGGRLCILEFSVPQNLLLRAAYMFYFKQIMPRTATFISRDRSGAYKYLPRSVNTFLSRPQMIRMMGDAGFRNVRQHPLTFGVAVAYVGIRS